MSNNQEKLNEQLYNVIANSKDNDEAKLKKVKYLVRLGADVNAIFFGKSMLFWAKRDENVASEVIEDLKDIGAKEVEISKSDEEELAKGFWDKNGDIKSVEEIKSLVRCGASLSGHKRNTNEQIWKDLSLEEMNEVLKILPKSYEIDGSVNLNVCGLKELPDFSKVKVRGNFNCSFNKLTTLERAPCKVGGDFMCYSNQLITLEGAPCKVGGDFKCYQNQLTTLEGAPSEVGGDFDCSFNQLTTLEGAPREVGGRFDCCDNQLTALEGKPQIIGYGFKIEEEVLAKIEENEKKQKAKPDVNLYAGNEGR